MRGLEREGRRVGTERKGEQLESEKKKQWKEREWERDIRGKRRDRPQQGDELLVKWLLFSSRASRLPFFGSSFSFPQSDIKHKPGKHSVCKQFWARREVIGPFTRCQVRCQS